MQKILILIFCSSLFLIGCNSNTIKEETHPVEITEDVTTAESNVINNEEESTDDYLLAVSTFISHVKNGKPEAIAASTRYPLSREHPLPDIENTTEFIEQYDDIFDEELKQEIINSNPENDWTKMGYEGIMLKTGILWLDVEGNLIAINRLSPIEVEKRISLIIKDKSLLHESIRDFDDPATILKTKKFQIRIDEVDEKYRYVSWGIDQLQSEKPDLIINGGDITMDGSGGNHYYTFKNGDYTYKCHIFVLGSSSSPEGMLVISKSGKEILKEDIISLE